MAETDGQAAEGLETTEGPQTTETAPSEEATSQQTTQSGTAETETFFDPESIKGKPELESAYKQMQAAFTKKSQRLKDVEQKVKVYDEFMQNPQSALQRLAAQYGYSLNQGNSQVKSDPSNPQTWDEVYAMAENRIMEKISPFLKEIKETRKSQLETMLDGSCPDWRVYEDDMMENLRKHPTLVNDPVRLYQLSVPQEVFMSRATQAAIKKLQDKASNAKLSNGSSTNQQASDTPKGKLSFDQAVAAAKAKLNAQGLKAPH